jgi:hypothetical protein
VGADPTIFQCRGSDQNDVFLFGNSFSGQRWMISPNSLVQICLGPTTTGARYVEMLVYPVGSSVLHLLTQSSRTGGVLFWSFVTERPGTVRLVGITTARNDAAHAPWNLTLTVVTPTS